jgi:hypothetical protein
MSSTPEADGDDLISLGAAAKVLGINKSTLSRQARTGQVRSHGGKVRLSEVREDRAKNVRATSAAEQDDSAAVAPASPLHEALHSPLHATKRATPRNDATPRATDRATPPAEATPLGDAAARVIEQVGGWIMFSMIASCGSVFCRAATGSTGFGAPGAVAT